MPSEPIEFMAAAAVALGTLAALPLAAAGQDEAAVYRISQRATVSQKLGNTLISVDYSRPLVRGRTELFGKVVHWGEMWTPGANEATVLEVDRPVELNGHEVEAGRWSMWIIPSQVGPWELVLDPTDSLFHTQRPEPTEEQIRLVIETRNDGPPTEALTWAFPRIAQDGGTLRMNWGTRRIDIEVEVESAMPVLTVAEEEAARYVGEWTATLSAPPGSDTAPPPTTLTLTYADGSLQAEFPPGVLTPPSPPDDDAPLDESMTPQERERAEARRALAETGGDSFRYVLVPRTEGIFLMGWVEDGVLLDVEKIYHEFEFEGSRAVRLVIRDGNSDSVVASAIRKTD